MSDFFAAAGVTAVLKWIMNEALATSGLGSVCSGATVTAMPPDRLPIGDSEVSQINLFMYHVSPNLGWRNTDMPVRDAQGQRLTNQPLAINLHYLLSAYGKSEFDSEILLAWGMQFLHETPVLTRSIVQSALDAMGSALNPTTEVKAISATTLARQAELVKITPESLSTEDIYKLWTAFQARYRPTTAYQATVVLIEGTQSVRSNLPVLSRNVLVEASQRPQIDDIRPAVIATGEELSIRGNYFIGENPADTSVVFDGATPLTPDLVQSDLIRVTVPPSVNAGARMVTITRAARFGSPGDPHIGSSSSAATVMVVPAISSSPASVTVGTNLTLTVAPPIARTQQVSIIIGDQSIALDARPASAPPSSATLVVPIPATFAHTTPPTNVALRVRVDEAESRLIINTSVNPPVYSPQIQVAGP
jgi:hypothetical protein